MGELTESLDETASGKPVPPCPRWSVHDVVAHLVGVVEDAMAGRLDGVATDPWTQAQVEARKQQSIPQMLASWSTAAPPFEGMLDEIGPVGRQAVLDAVTHEHDIRTALGEPAARQPDAVIIGYEFGAPAFLEDAEGHGARIRLEGVDVQPFGPLDRAFAAPGIALRPHACPHRPPQPRTDPGHGLER